MLCGCVSEVKGRTKEEEAHHLEAPNTDAHHLVVRKLTVESNHSCTDGPSKGQASGSSAGTYSHAQTGTAFRASAMEKGLTFDMSGWTASQRVVNHQGHNHAAQS